MKAIPHQAKKEVANLLKIEVQQKAL